MEIIIGQERDGIFLAAPFGLPVNRVLATIIAYRLALELNLNVPISIARDRIVLGVEKRSTPQSIRAILVSIGESDVLPLLGKALGSSVNFSRNPDVTVYNTLKAKEVLRRIGKNEIQVSGLSRKSEETRVRRREEGRLVLHRQAIELAEPAGMMAQPLLDSGLQFPNPKAVGTWTESLVLTVPANTSVGKEVNAERVLRATGRIRVIVLFFPSGAAGTTGVFVTLDGDQVFPTTDGDSIALDNTTISYVTNIPVSRGQKLRLNGNNSDSSPHTIRIQYTIEVPIPLQ